MAPPTPSSLFSAVVLAGVAIVPVSQLGCGMTSDVTADASATDAASNASEDGSTSDATATVDADASVPADAANEDVSDACDMDAPKFPPCPAIR